ncbi:hypothetical protein Goshw_018082 [Gossypium schwendimanii]|uniref:PPPDE domain-containing protein n=4 Tax=Gossypium TaxID=3633 RepID=A0A7J9MVY2_GOSSC|nr:hypothetical protein [Gossypium lobatum]MBA0728617.1 hypothetical protein [Gossypium laxum]MBA0874529.1 hypothetical protein [Gossypium schwendimanii]
MGKGKVSNSSHNESNDNETKLVLNIYDLTPMNNYSYWIGFGIFHSGIEVHGKEYGFGAHDFSISGVFEVEPKCCPGFSYRCSISLGRINMSSSDFRAFIENLASDYHGNTYHLISKNCNHFSDDIVYKLTGKHIPRWVNRLARLGSLFSCLLPESLQATRVKKVPEYHQNEGNETLSTTTPSEIDETEQENPLLSPKDGSVDINFVKAAPSDCKTEMP